MSVEHSLRTPTRSWEEVLSGTCESSCVGEPWVCVRPINAFKHALLNCMLQTLCAYLQIQLAAGSKYCVIQRDNSPNISAESNLRKVLRYNLTEFIHIHIMAVMASWSGCVSKLINQSVSSLWIPPLLLPMDVTVNYSEPFQRFHVSSVFSPSSFPLFCMQVYEFHIRQSLLSHFFSSVFLYSAPLFAPFPSMFCGLAKAWQPNEIYTFFFLHLEVLGGFKES